MFVSPESKLAVTKLFAVADFRIVYRSTAQVHKIAGVTRLSCSIHTADTDGRDASCRPARRVASAV